jgi:hypothetical protein
LAEIVATRPPLAEAAEAAALAYERPVHRWQNFQLHVTRVTGHGADDASLALLNMIEAERGERDDAGAAMNRAKKDLQNVDWIIECRRDDLAQLHLMLEPPRPPVVLGEVVKRRVPDNGDVDTIIMPHGAASRAA